jgi:trimeric autotransporter adhesin
MLGNGNVGIGTTSPGAKLDVQGNIYALTGTSGQGIFLRGPALTTVTSQPSLTLSNAWGGNADGLRVNAYSGIGLYANDTLGLFVAGTNSGYTVGNVGIGTTAPSTLLHVYRNAAGSSVNITGGAVGSRNDTGIDFSIINATSVVYGRIAQQVTTASIGAEVGGLVFSTINSGTLAERMFIQGDGKVGIGTTSPGRLLEVGVTGAAGVVGIARFSHSVGGNQRSWDIGVGEAASFGANDNFGIKDSSGGNTVLVIDTSGNVGIDTTSPGAKLDVKSSGISTWAIRALASDSGSLGGIYEGADTSADFYLYKADGSTIGVRLNSVGDCYLNTGGNVGIGTTGPISKLNVNGGGTDGRIFVVNGTNTLTQVTLQLKFLGHQRQRLQEVRRCLLSVGR